jgi:hypothetical protein
MPVGFSDSQNEVDLDTLRARLRKMTDGELARFGRTAQYMCSPRPNLGKPPRQVFVIQLEEAQNRMESQKSRAEGKDTDGATNPR